MEQKYKALRIIATLYKVLAVIVAGLTLLAALAFCALGIISGGASSQSSSMPFGGAGNIVGGAVGGIFTGIFALIYGGLTALGLYGFGELVMVLLSIEESTRGSYVMLQEHKSRKTVQAPEPTTASPQVPPSQPTTPPAEPAS